MAVLVTALPPCVLHEDEHLLVVNKPPGLNTHSPSPFAGEGIYEWLLHRESLWAGLAIIHRLEKETSGVMVFGKTALANRSLTGQFSSREVRKRYVLLTDREVSTKVSKISSALVRAGARYLSRPIHAGAEIAETEFRVLESIDKKTLIAAEPLTGKTHQIRVHAAEQGFPILGDELYGGTNWSRLCLHSEKIVFRHPASEHEVSLAAPPQFATDRRLPIRSSLIGPDTNAFRIVHGHSDGLPEIFADRLGDYLLVHATRPLQHQESEILGAIARFYGCRGTYLKVLSKYIREEGAGGRNLAESDFRGEAAPTRFTILENGVSYELSFAEGYSVGLFLDQRENRRRLLSGHLAADFEFGLKDREVLNTFAYTCAFSVCAALAGARTTSLDLSKKYLEWGRRNFLLNQIKGEHDFIFGDTFDWLRRLTRKGRSFDLILLDPPTFPQSSESGVFQAERDYGKLVSAALPLLKSDGVLFCSTNAARLQPGSFLEQVQQAIRMGRDVN